ncbi:hypothetical protein GGI07_004097, partial [Coemansia sp. Benny D115]
MTSYSFSDPSTTLVGSALDNSNANNTGAGGANGNSGVVAGGSIYNSARVYRRDSVMAGPHHTSDYQLHQPSQTLDPKNMHSSDHTTASSSLNGALAGISNGTANDSAFADYFFKQQVMSLNAAGHADSNSHSISSNQQRQQNSNPITSVAAAVAAAAATQTSSAAASLSAPTVSSSAASSLTSIPAQAQRQYSYTTYNCQDSASSNHQSPSAAAAALPGSTITMQMNSATADSSSASATPNSLAETQAASAACLVDPLPSFLSSLPLPSSMEPSKFSSMVAGTRTNNVRNVHGGAALGDSGNQQADENGNNNNGGGGGSVHNGPSNSIFEAAAAAAAAAV